MVWTAKTHGESLYEHPNVNHEEEAKKRVDAALAEIKRRDERTKELCREVLREEGLIK